MSSTQFDGDIDSFVSYLKSNRGLSANTLKAYRADLTACLHLFELRGVTDLNEITLDDLRSWMAVESRDHARSSMARKTVAVRGFFAWAYEHGVTNTDPAATLMTPSIPSTLPAVLTESQAEQLLDVAEHAVATNQYKGDGGAAAAPGSGKAAGKTADKSADTVNRSEAPARADKRDSARVTAESQRNAAILELLYAVRTTRPACAGDLAGTGAAGTGPYGNGCSQVPCCQRPVPRRTRRPYRPTHSP